MSKQSKTSRRKKFTITNANEKSEHGLYGTYIKEKTAQDVQFFVKGVPILLPSPLQ